MIKPKKGEKGESANDSPSFSPEDLLNDIGKELRKEHGEIVATWNTSDVRYWIPTGSKLLDYVISNKRDGGWPVGRIVEVYGAPSIGKSHIGIQACISVQKMGGVAVYIDTENGVSLGYLQKLGVNPKSLLLIQEKAIQKIFGTIETAIRKVREKQKDALMVIVWDSIAGSKAKEVLEGSYEDNHIGIDARALSKGFAMITDEIAKNNILLLCLNQTRVKIGCVNPSTMVEVKGLKMSSECCETKSTIKDFIINDLKLDYDNLPTNEEVLVDGWQIKSYDLAKKEIVWADIKSVIKKEQTKACRVTTDKIDITVSPEHKFYAKLKPFVVDKEVNNARRANMDEMQDVLPDWYEAIQLVTHTNNHYNKFLLLTDENNWTEANIEILDEVTEIVDFHIVNTHCYFSNGVLSHNTLYGDPMTTPGGQALPYYASVRLRLTGGKHIEGEDEVPLGIEVNAYTIKNKTAIPFRKCSFEILFNRGIKEYEQLFDVMRSHCDADNRVIMHGSHKTFVEGTGAWKTFKVIDSNDTVLIEEKFHKPKFGKLWDNEKYAPYLEAILESAMVADFDKMYPPDSKEDEELENINE